MNIERQIHKEAWITLLVYALFFLWWYGFGYGLDPALTIFHIPAWFFMSCLMGAVFFNIIFYLVIKKYFVEMPFDDEAV